MNTVEILDKLIRFKTVTSDLAENTRSLKWCQKTLSGRNIRSEILEINGRPTLVWGDSPARCRILINSHIDVVPAPDSLFSPKITASRITGRGALDTKSSVAALLSLPAQTINQALRKNICFSLVSDEEIGGPSSRQFIRSMTDLKWAVFLEPTGFRIINEAKGIMQLKITALGKAAHGSRPWDGTNAIEILCSNLSRFLKSHPTPKKETRKTTFNFSLISGGSAINQTPSGCELTVDVRYHPNDNPLKILSDFKKAFPGCRVEVLKSESHIASDPGHPLTKTLVRSFKSQKIPAVFSFDHASSDARHCTETGIPAVIFGPVGGGQHQSNEWVDIKSIEKTRKVIETFISFGLDFALSGARTNLPPFS